MSIRTFTIVLLPLLVGVVAAKATAPQIVDPRDDMSDASSGSVMISPVPSSPNPTPADPAALAPGTPTKTDASHSQAGLAVSAPKAELPANPLWTIPLSALTETRVRPPFSPNRRPPQPAVIATTVAAPPPPKPVEPVKPQLSLVGTVVGGGNRIGVFVDLADKSTLHLKAGDKHNGWVLRAVDAHQVELANGLDSAVLKLPDVDLKSVAGPSVPQTPVAIVAQSMATPSSPLNAAMPAKDAPHMGINLPGLAARSLIKPKP